MKNLNQILEIYLIKTKTYEKTEKIKNLNDLTLNECLIKLKKSLQIINKYHINNKQILFIGLPNNISKKINNSTNHIAITKNANLKLKNLLLNKTIFNKQIKKISPLSLLPKTTKLPNLIVLVDSEHSDILKKECYLSKIPTITVTTEINSLYPSLYNIPLNLKTINYNKNIFFICLNFLFKNQSNILFKHYLDILNFNYDKKKKK